MEKELLEKLAELKLKGADEQSLITYAYTQGFIDGIKRAGELANEEFAKVI